jgi:hypothetical protein
LVSVDVQEFSANSPLDYAELNKLVLAIKTIAAAMPTVSTTAPNAGSTGSATVANTAQTILCGTYHLTNAPALGAKGIGGNYTVPFMRDNKPVTFSSPPHVIAWATPSNPGTGMAILNKNGVSTTTNFPVRGGWVSRSTTGNFYIQYIAIGTEVPSS